MLYRCATTSVAGFVQQLATAYIGHGYRYYAVRRIPRGKELRGVDARIVAAYGLALSKWQRSRRRRAGQANAQYIRHGLFAVLIATPPEGGHPFFRECPDYQDIRKRAIRFAGYSIGCSYSTRTRRWHASVRVEREQFMRMKAYFEEVATKRSTRSLSRELGGLRFEPFAKVARQYLSLLKRVNACRAAAGLEQLPESCLRLHRKSILPFETRASSPSTPERMLGPWQGGEG